MAESAALDAGNLAQFLIADTPPSLWQTLPVLEGVWVLGDALDTPLGARGVTFGVEHVEDLRGSSWEGGLDREEVVFPRG